MANTSGVQSILKNGNGQTMNVDAASYWNAMVAKIEADTGIKIAPTEGTRTYARQKYLYNLYLSGKGNPAWSPDSPKAYHLSGRAVDVASNVGYINTNNARVFRAYCGTYGFRETVPGEPWHFEWRADWVSPEVGAVVSSPAKPSPITTIPTLEGIIKLYENTCTLYESPNGRLALACPAGILEFGPNNGTGFGGEEQLEVVTKLKIQRVKFDNDILFDRWLTMIRAAK